MSVLIRCGESGCPHLVRWADRCPAHRTSTIPDRMPTRQELPDPRLPHPQAHRPADPTHPSGDTR